MAQFLDNNIIKLWWKNYTIPPLKMLHMIFPENRLKYYSKNGQNPSEKVIIPSIEKN